MPKTKIMKDLLTIYQCAVIIIAGVFYLFLKISKYILSRRTSHKRLPNRTTIPTYKSTSNTPSKTAIYTIKG